MWKRRKLTNSRKRKMESRKKKESPRKAHARWNAEATQTARLSGHAPQLRVGVCVMLNFWAAVCMVSLCSVCNLLVFRLLLRWQRSRAARQRSRAARSGACAVSEPAHPCHRPAQQQNAGYNRAGGSRGFADA